MDRSREYPSRLSFTDIARKCEYVVPDRQGGITCKFPPLPPLSPHPEKTDERGDSLLYSTTTVVLPTEEHAALEALVDRASSEITLQLKDGDFCISRFTIVKRGKGLEMIHRIVNPSYRGLGIGTEMISALHNVIHESLVDTLEDKNVYAVVTEGDVLSLLWKLGYRPENIKQDERFQYLMMKINEGKVRLRDRCSFYIEKSRWEYRLVLSKLLQQPDK